MRKSTLVTFGAILFVLGLSIGFSISLLFTIGMLAGQALPYPNPARMPAAEPTISYEDAPEPETSPTAALAAAWQVNGGVNTVMTAKEIIPFPYAVDGFIRAGEGMDLWGVPVKNTGQVRIVKGKEWVEVSDGIGGMFPTSKQGCEDGMWMIRWRTSDTDLGAVASKLNRPDDVVVSQGVLGPYGYMVGGSCEVPVFRFNVPETGTTRVNTVDVSYELRFWRTEGGGTEVY